MGWGASQGMGKGLLAVGQSIDKDLKAARVNEWRQKQVQDGREYDAGQKQNDREHREGLADQKAATRVEERQSDREYEQGLLTESREHEAGLLTEQRELDKGRYTTSTENDVQFQTDTSNGSKKVIHDGRTSTGSSTADQQNFGLWRKVFPNDTDDEIYNRVKGVSAEKQAKALATELTKIDAKANASDILNSDPNFNPSAVYQGYLEQLMNKPADEQAPAQNGRFEANFNILRNNPKHDGISDADLRSALQQKLSISQ